jgi:hypothetical protein
MEGEGMENKEEGKEVERASKKETSLQPFYVNSLLTIETCGYFEAGYKRRHPTKEQPTKILTVGDNHKIEFIPSQKYGYSNADDLDFLHAFYRICDEKAQRVERVHPDGSRSWHFHLQQPVAIPLKKLLRYASRSFNAREKKTARDFFYRNAFTGIKGELQDPKTRAYGSVAFTLFSQVALKGEKLKNNTEAETNLVWLSPYALRCYYWRLTRKEDNAFHQLLTTAIGKVLYPYLDSGFFASVTKGGKSYEKEYAALCELLSLPAYKYLARIKQQLDPAHTELQQLGYLDTWEYRKGINNTWLVIWYPGLKWFEDVRARGFTLTPKLEAPTQQKEQPTFEDLRSKLLAEDIQKVFPEDEKSRAFYERVARKLPEDQTRKVLADIRADILNNPATTARNPAAIFTTRIKEVAQRLGISL